MIGRRDTDGSRHRARPAPRVTWGSPADTRQMKHVHAHGRCLFWRSCRSLLVMLWWESRHSAKPACRILMVLWTMSYCDHHTPSAKSQEAIWWCVTFVG